MWLIACLSCVCFFCMTKKQMVKFYYSHKQELYELKGLCG